MPIVTLDINRQQLLQLAKVAIDAIFPFWIQDSKPGMSKKNWIRFLVALFLSLCIVFIFAASPFPSTVSTSNNGKLIPLAGGVSALVIWSKTAGCILLLTFVVVSFLVDLREVLTPGPFHRFKYAEPNQSKKLKSWWITVILLGSYLFRIWFFSIISFFGLLNANVASIVWGSGPIVFLGPRTVAQNVSTILMPLGNPLGFWELTGQDGPTIAVLFVFWLEVTRFIILTFLFGVFAAIVRRLSSGEENISAEEKQ